MILFQKMFSLKLHLLWIIKKHFLIKINYFAWSPTKKWPDMAKTSEAL